MHMEVQEYPSAEGTRGWSLMSLLHRMCFGCECVSFTCKVEGGRHWGVQRCIWASGAGHLGTLKSERSMLGFRILKFCRWTPEDQRIRKADPGISGGDRHYMQTVIIPAELSAYDEWLNIKGFNSKESQVKGLLWWLQRKETEFWSVLLS